MNEDIARVKLAYIELLRISHGAMRMRLQSTLCALRDEIADYFWVEKQFIQDTYEHFVKEGHHLL